MYLSQLPTTTPESSVDKDDDDQELQDAFLDALTLLGESMDLLESAKGMLPINRMIFKDITNHLESIQEFMEEQGYEFEEVKE